MSLICILTFLADAPQKPPWWDVAWSTWALVAVGIAATILAWKTLSDLKEQTKTAKTAADAALKNAEAVISAERAWIMVELEWIPGYLGVARGEGNQTGKYISAPIRFKCRNEGKTIAWIDEKLACFQIVKDLPKQPDFTVLELLDPIPEWVAAGGVKDLEAALSAPGRDDPVYMSVIWGVIRYRDAFNAKHETVFGFSITPGSKFERIAGLMEYNKTT